MAQMWMLGAHCNPHLCHLLTSLDPTLVGWFSTEALGVVVHFIEIMIADFVLLLQRMEPFRTVVGVEHPVHVLMAFELNAHQIPGFLFVPVCTNPDVLDARDGRGSGLRERNNDFDFKGDVHALEGFGDVDSVGVRGLVHHRLSHQMVGDFPISIGASFGVVRTGDHGTIIDASVKAEEFGHC